MKHKLFVVLDCIIMLAMLGGALVSVDPTQASWLITNSASVTTQTAAVQPNKVPIDPNIYQNLKQESTAWVLVILEQQADLGGASQFVTKAEKGAFVYHQLTTTAAQTQGPLRAFLDAKGAEYEAYWIINMLMVNVDADLLDELAHQPGIARIASYVPPEPELPLEEQPGATNGAEFGPFLQAHQSIQASGNHDELVEVRDSSQPTTVEWNIQRVGADDVWAMGYTGEGVVIGSLDTGVDITHPALVNQYAGNLGGGNFDHNYNWFDGAGGSPFPVDYGFHGTYTMGPILGEESGHINQIGMAPGAKWIACPGSGSPYVTQLECYQWFLAPTDLNGNNPRTDLAPDVINQTSFPTADDHLAVQALVAAGIYISQPAGNNGPQCRTLQLPYNQWPEVSSVAAFNQTDQITDFSARGPVMVGHETLIKPDITAPGENVRTSIPLSWNWGPYFVGYGTSLAAPHVSGAAALLISAVPELRGRVDLIEMLLKTNAEPKATFECTPAGGVPNNVWGWGILNVYNAAQAAQSLELGAIEGQVVEAGTQNPIASVQLSFTETSLTWPYQETSADLGDYGHALPVGSYDITARHYGYLDNSIGGVEISQGVTTTQNIEMSLAPAWTISGVVTDALTGEPLPASIVLESTPISTETNPQTGEYVAQAAQGEWWLVVTSPGYAEQAIKITLDQDRVENFGLEPIANYYMRRSVDGGCGTQFDWLDATGGTRVIIDWRNFYYALFPQSRSFNFYGTTYTGVYINAHGVVTFGSGFSNPSGPIPNPNLPNNAIYAFSTMLNPEGEPWMGAGAIYTDMIDNRYFVIEWHEVSHWVNRDPETFEIILDLDTNLIKIQYLTVNDSSGVVAGVENFTGTGATQYAYGDPSLLADNTAVELYPWFGAPPPMGIEGELSGEVTDASTDLPIEGALITATAFQTGGIFTYTTDLNGNYYALLCADWYNVVAQAPEYLPSPEVRVSIYPNEHTIQDFGLTLIISAPDVITLMGPVDGRVSTSYSFTATVEPISTTLPLEYVWEADGQETVTHTAGLIDTISYIWEMPGTYAVSVTASNMAGTADATHMITITMPVYETYLPLSIKAGDSHKPLNFQVFDNWMPIRLGRVWTNNLIYSLHLSFIGLRK